MVDDTSFNFGLTSESPSHPMTGSATSMIGMRVQKTKWGD
jgi:hypothetical protein